MRPAIIIVDMVKDNFKEGSRSPITQEARGILPNLKRLLEEGRKREIPIFFACDSYLEEDFIFRGKMKAHSLQGTRGAEVVDDLKPERAETILPKRRFSAFFKTDLEQTLRKMEVDTLVVAGLTTEFCVLTTVLDGLCHDFYVILLEDCAASHDRERHQTCLSLYRDTALHPLLRVLTLEAWLNEVPSSGYGTLT